MQDITIFERNHILKSCSTGKSKSKQTQPRRTEYATCSKLQSNSANKRDYERSQPIKIAQLIRVAESLKKGGGNTVRKRILPEKLGQFSSVRSSKLKETHSGIKKQFRHFNNNVRRNLNFNDISGDAITDNNDGENKSNQQTVNRVANKVITVSVKKKSLLLAPNSIKEKHLNKSTKGKNKYSKLPQLSEKFISADKKTNAYTGSKTKIKDKEVEEANPSLLTNKLPKKGNNSVHSEYVEASNKYKIATSSNDVKQTKNSNMPRILIEAPKSLDSSTYPNDNCLQPRSSHKNTFVPNKINSEKKVLKDVKNGYKENMDNILMESESNTNEKYLPSKIICVDENEIIRLERDLRNLLSATEENVVKIKSTLTCVTRLLSINRNEIIGDERCFKTGLETVMVDKEVQVDNCELMLQTENNAKASTVHSSQINVTDNVTCNYISQSIESNENNKENQQTLNVKHISNGVHSNVQNCTQQSTPMKIKHKQEQTFKEYMVLKSTMSFLETPDIKQFKSLRRSENTSVMNKSHISHKVLTDLLNLYSDSPETN